MECNSYQTKSCDPVYLEETFFVLARKKRLFRVKLTASGLYLSKESSPNSQSLSQIHVPITGIIGCRCLRSRRRQSPFCGCTQPLYCATDLRAVDDEHSTEELDENDDSAYLYIYTYECRKNAKRTTTARAVTAYKTSRKTITLRFRSFDTYENNFKEAQRWRVTLKKLMFGEHMTSPIPLGLDRIPNISTNSRLLVLCNPKSGRGKSETIFRNFVLPLLQEAEVCYDLHVTLNANYARQFVRTNNIFQWNGIMLIGGDGIIFEVINGVFERTDWLTALRTLPIGVIPTGSGNGLARSIAYQYKIDYEPKPCLPLLLASIRANRTSLLDLVRIETRTQIMFSFLSVGWGLIADIDIESERLRLLGGIRFTVWCILRLLKLRTYRGTVWYHAHNVPLLSSSQKSVPTSPPTWSISQNDGALEQDSNSLMMQSLDEDSIATRSRMNSWHSTASPKNSFYSTCEYSSYKTTVDPNAPNGRIGQMFGPASQLPCITAPLTAENGWSCVQGEFYMVHASYQTHLGEDCLFAPDSRLDDGLMWLLIVRAENTSRVQLLNLMLGLNSGTHATKHKIESQSPTNGPTSDVDSPSIQFIPVNAFRIEPDVQSNPYGYLTVDGEQVEYGPIQAEICPKLARVLVP